MEGGRPLGRKNQRGHDAGGRRSGAGRPRKGEEGSIKRIRTAPSDAERREQLEHEQHTTCLYIWHINLNLKRV